MLKFLEKYKFLLVFILGFFSFFFFIDVVKAEQPTITCPTKTGVNLGQGQGDYYGYVYTSTQDDSDTNVFTSNNVTWHCVYVKKNTYTGLKYSKVTYEVLKNNGFFGSASFLDEKYAQEDREDEKEWKWETDVFNDGKVTNDLEFPRDKNIRTWIEYKYGGKDTKRYIYYFGEGWSTETSNDVVTWDGVGKASLKNKTWGYFGAKYSLKSGVNFPGPYECVCIGDDPQGGCYGQKLDCSSNAVAIKVIPLETAILSGKHNYTLYLKSLDGQQSNQFNLSIETIDSECEDLLQPECNNSEELKLCKWGWDVNKVEYGCIDYASGSTPVDAPISTPATVERERIPMPPGYKGPLPECAFNGSCDNVNDFLELAINVGKWLFSFIGGLAFVFFVYGGFTMILSFGSAEKFKKGQQILVAAVIGMIIAFGAYALVKFLLESIGVQESWIGLIYTK